jgi:hypothetical protein
LFHDASAGPAIESTENGTELLGTPPVSILLHQELIESSVTKPDGVSVKTSFIEQTLFSMSCGITENGISLIPYDIDVKLDSPSATPQRTLCTVDDFAMTNGSVTPDVDVHSLPAKRLKLSENGHCEDNEVGYIGLMDEVSRLADLISAKLEDES